MHSRLSANGNTIVSLSCLVVQGDSGFLLARGGSVQMRSKPMQHYFDCPRQFGACPEYVGATDNADDADEYKWEAQPGDVIIMGTDGLWDNCFGEELLKLLPQCPEDAQKAADQIAALAQRHSMDPTYESPFVVEARDQGMDLQWWEKLLQTRVQDGRIECGRLLGGKLDDITVVAAYVMEAKR
ncbi:unnamed protein product [Ostreobium quekettii]|uniref:Protein phosphatase n=1 Tax=Ostreobium quekettii TaxID=121088 RepID=A0A8S1JDB0_9CHLO|nr:unnamed protein product [Ostreobium quekettii]